MLVKLASPEDGEQIAQIYRPYVEESAISFERVAPDGKEMAARVEKTLVSHPWLVAAEQAKGLVAAEQVAGVQANAPQLGYAYAGPHRSRAAYAWSVEVSIYLRTTARGKGLGKRLYRALFEMLRAQGFGMAFAGVVIPNPASEALHEGLGFEAVGEYPSVGFKDGVWHTTRWYGMPLQALGDAPSPPETPADVLTRADWHGVNSDFFPVGLA